MIVIKLLTYTCECEILQTNNITYLLYTALAGLSVEEKETTVRTSLAKSDSGLKLSTFRLVLTTNNTMFFLFQMIIEYSIFKHLLIDMPTYTV